jgi:hypothetical protein
LREIDRPFVPYGVGGLHDFELDPFVFHRNQRDLELAVTKEAAWEDGLPSGFGAGQPNYRSSAPRRDGRSV